MSGSESAAGEVILVILEGGPADIPPVVRRWRADPAEDRVKIPHRGGYEHFERTGESHVGGDGTPAAIFRWVRRTRIAE